MIRLAVLTAVLVSLWISPLVAQAPPAGGPPTFGERGQAPIEKTGPGVFRIGEVQIHKSARSVTFPAQVNMDKGLLEYLLVRSSGKTHESLLKTEVDPYTLNIAFLLLGFEGADKPISDQGANENPQGEPLEITIVCQAAGKSWRGPAEAWVVMRTDEKEESPVLKWVYTGSKVFHGRFLAQEQGSIVAIYHDPTALIDHTTAGGHSDDVWYVREGTVPPVGTPVTVIIKAQSAKR